jgi:hemolysin activation/secretion protein
MMSLTLYGAAQTSFGKPLMISEQFALDGPGAVSGFPTGTFVVDEGALGRVEFGETFFLPVQGGSVPIEPYVFGAGAIGFIDDATALQQATLHVGTVGLGARATVNSSGIPSGADLGVEVGRYVSDVPAEHDGWRGNLSLSIRF